MTLATASTICHERHQPSLVCTWLDLVNRRRQRDHPDFYFCWRRHESRLLTNPEEVLM